MCIYHLRKHFKQRRLVIEMSTRRGICGVTTLFPYRQHGVEALLAGADLPQALDAACARTDVNDAWDFSAWLTAAVTDGLVTGVHRPTPHNPTEHTP